MKLSNSGRCRPQCQQIAVTRCLFHRISCTRLLYCNFSSYTRFHLSSITKEELSRKKLDPPKMVPKMKLSVLTAAVIWRLTLLHVIPDWTLSKIFTCTFTARSRWRGPRWRLPPSWATENWHVHHVQPPYCPFSRQEDLQPITTLVSLLLWLFLGGNKGGPIICFPWNDFYRGPN